MLQVLLDSNPLSVNENAVTATQIHDPCAVLRIDFQTRVKTTDDGVFKIKVTSRISSKGKPILCDKMQIAPFGTKTHKALSHLRFSKNGVQSSGDTILVIAVLSFHLL